GNIYVAGQFTGTITIGNDTLTAAGSGYDIAVVKIQESVVSVSPMVNLSITCGDTAVLNGVASNYASVQWLPATGLSNATILNPTVNNLLETRTYTLRATDLCSNTVSDSVTVTVNPPFTLNAVANNQTIQCGNSTQLSATASDGNAFFSWSPSAGLSNPSSANPVASPGATTTYTVTATIHNGC